MTKPCHFHDYYFNTLSDSNTTRPSCKLAKLCEPRARELLQCRLANNKTKHIFLNLRLIYNCQLSVHTYCDTIHCLKKKKKKKNGLKHLWMGWILQCLQMLAWLMLLSSFNIFKKSFPRRVAYFVGLLYIIWKVYKQRIKNWKHFLEKHFLKKFRAISEKIDR